MGKSLFYETFGQIYPGKNSGLDLGLGDGKFNCFFLICMAASEKDTIRQNYDKVFPASRTVPGPGMLSKY